MKHENKKKNLKK